MSPKYAVKIVKIPSKMNGFPSAIVAISGVEVPLTPITTRVKRAYRIIGIVAAMIIAFFISCSFLLSTLSASGIAENPKNANIITPTGRNAFCVWYVNRLLVCIFPENNIRMRKIIVSTKMSPIVSPFFSALIPW